MKKIYCLLEAITLWVKSGIWCPHVYKEVSREPAIIITTEKSFRISPNYIHNENECVHANATLIKSKCKYCGSQELSWFDGKEEDITIIE